MNKLIKYLIIFVSTFGVCANKSFAQTQSVPEQKKKIVIVWSKGGGAHKAMLRSLTDQLSGEYDIVPLNPFEKIWKLADMACGPFSNILSEFLSPLDGRTICNYVRKRDMGLAFASGVEYFKFFLANKNSKSVSKALLNNKEMVIRTLNILSDVFEDSEETGGGVKKDGEDFYNELLKSDKTKIVNGLNRNQMQDIAQNAPEIQQRFESYFLAEKPDLVISLIPMFNSAMLEASHACEIPFLLISPDFDTSNYFYSKTPHIPETWGRRRDWQMPKFVQPAPRHNFACILPFEVPLIKEKAQEAGILQQVKGYGFPLRSDFFESKDEFKAKFKVSSEVKIVMILMGSAGSKKVIDYVEHIAQETAGPIHILACVGNDKNTANELENIKFHMPKNISLNVIEHTDQISNLMAISDVLITKPGPSTLCEAIQMRVPVIIDATTTPLEWEQLHITFVKEHKIGAIMTPEVDFGTVYAQVIRDQKNIRDNMSALSEGNKNFPHRLEALIATLIADQEKSHSLTHTISRWRENQADSFRNLAIGAGSAVALAGAYLAYRGMHRHPAV